MTVRRPRGTDRHIASELRRHESIVIGSAPDQERRAARFVASRSRDTADARLLLEHLGLIAPRDEGTDR